MPVDPRLNCAAEICCPPPAARQAKESLVADLLDENKGFTPETRSKLCGHVVDRMAELDIEFAPGELMRAIRDLADHPNRKEK